MGDTLQRSQLEEMDKAGSIKRKLISPIYKDSVMVQDGGYIVLRFKADNPGIYNYPCVSVIATVKFILTARTSAFSPPVSLHMQCECSKRLVHTTAGTEKPLYIYVTSPKKCPLNTINCWDIHTIISGDVPLLIYLQLHAGK